MTPLYHHRPRILFLPRWYPNRYDPMPGLFIRRQAEALSAYCEVAVVYVHPDPECPNESETEYARENEVDVVRVYYRPGRSVVSRWKEFYQAHLQGLAIIKGFTPDLVHAHVLTREGFIAWRIARRFGVSFVVSEHWSRYFPENDTYQGFARKMLTRFVIRRSSAVITVSEKLKSAMQACGLEHPGYKVVPNVVEGTLFHPPGTTLNKGKLRFVHISCFEDKSKDISGFLRAVKELSGRRKDFECHLVGEGPDLTAMKDLAGRLGLLDELVFFEGLKEEEALVREITTSDFTILSSRYETFGTVIIESLSCGVPVVSTAVGIAPEIIRPENGLLVRAGDPSGLAEALDRMLGICRNFDPQTVRDTIGNRFTRDTVARLLMDIYEQILTREHV